jgi:hypothetical protein
MSVLNGEITEEENISKGSSSLKEPLRPSLDFYGIVLKDKTQP